MSDNFMEELLKEFLTESSENLDRLDRDLIALEKNPTDKELLGSIFRAVHTIKGTCGFLGFSNLESVTHVGETLLAHLRDGKLLLNEEITNTLLELIDALRNMMSSIANSGNDGEENWEALIAKLSKPLEKIVVAPEPLEEANTALDEHQQNNDAFMNNGIRVDVNLLDNLMALVGELVLSRNEMLQVMSSQSNSTNLITISQRVDTITSELQAGVMKTRMQPIGNAWKKFPRMVRDLSNTCKKKVKLELFGEETELDKTLIETIKDPLTHILRNAIDHGIETPEQRKAANKPEEGLLQIRAFHEGGKVNIEIIDDGKGISPATIKEKTLAKGLLSAQQLSQMSEREIVNLIFLPGFSTAETVTNISGRGVGMDVVRNNIEKINGIIDVVSQPGKNTTITIKIPLTLAIIPALIVACRNQRYAIPQTNVMELLRLDIRDTNKNPIEFFQDTPVYRLRGQLLPLVFLHKELQIDNHEASTEVYNIVVAQINEVSFGLVVDRVYDVQEIVIKPLDKQLKGISVYAGASIMGDGHVALILDLLHMAERCHLIADKQKSSMLMEQHEIVEKVEDDRQDLLLVHGQSTGKMVIPMNDISRLEEISKEEIETINSQDVVQYRGKIMPLIHLATAIQDRRKLSRTEDESDPRTLKRNSDMLQVVVYNKGQTHVGIVIHKFIDIIRERLVIERPGTRPGVLGSMIIQDFVAEILDIDGLVNKETTDLWQITTPETTTIGVRQT